jgi:arsenite methyltransferase
MMKDREIKRVVKEGYARIAKQAAFSSVPCHCCGCSSQVPEDMSKRLGYTDEELLAAPPESNLGLGCGNPVSLASIEEGNYVLDLGSGAGFDCFLASRIVGPSGKVIGVDMTSEMVEKARANARIWGYSNVDFRQGELENMPVADNYIDVVISNCVINLIPDKSRVFKEAFRVLKPGGRLVVSDIVLQKTLPEFVENSTEAYIGCLAGAVMKDDYIQAMRAAGFQEIQVMDESSFPIECLVNDSSGQTLVGMPKFTADQIAEVSNSIMSLMVSAVKLR